MKSFLRKFWRCTRWFLACLCLFAVILDLWFVIVGLPQFLLRRVEHAINAPGGTCKISWGKGGLFAPLELGGITIVTPTKLGKVQTSIDELKLDFFWSNLLTCQVIPKRCSISNGASWLDLHETTISTAPQSFFLKHFKADLAVTSGDLLQGQISMNLHGIDVLCRINLANGSQIIPWLSNVVLPTPQSSAHHLLGPLAVIHGSAQPFSLLASKTSLNLVLTGDLNNFQNATLEGNFGMATGVIRQVVVPQTHLQFTYNNGIFNLNNLQLLLSHSEIITGNGVVDFNRKVATGKLQGNIFPTTGLRLAGLSPTLFPDGIVFTAPMDFHLSLSEAAFPLNNILPILNFHCNDLVAYGYPIRHFAGKLTYNDANDTLALQDARLDFGYSNKYRLTGSANLQLKEQLISAQLQGNINLPEVVHKVFQTPRLPSTIKGLDNTNIAINLEPSPLRDWKKWQLDGTLSNPRFRLGEMIFLENVAELSLSNAVAKLEKLSLKLHSDSPNQLSANATCDLSPLLQKLPLEVAVGAALDVYASPDDAPRRALETAAKFVLDTQQNTLTIPDLQVSARPEILNELLTPQLKLTDDSPLSYIQCLGKEPLQLKLSLPAWNFLDAPPVTLSGSIELQNGSVLDVPLTVANSPIQLTAKGLTLQQLHVQCANNATVIDAALEMNFSPFRLQVTDLELKGPPEPIEPWLVDDDARDYYKTIWSYFTWSPQHPPKLSVPYLLLEEFNDWASWHFELGGTIRAENVTHRNMVIPEIQCEVQMDLPDDGIHITNIRIAGKDKTPMTGELSLTFGDDIAGVFNAAFTEGQQDVLELLRNAAPELAEPLADFRLHPETHFTCDGEFAVGANSQLKHLKLAGTIDAPNLHYKEFCVENVKGNWTGSNEFFTWDFPALKFNGGTIATTGEYNFRRHTGTCLTHAKAIPLQALSALQGTIMNSDNTKTDDNPKPQQNPKPLAGFVNAEASLTFYRNWANHPLHTEGYGTIHVYDADLWRVPLMTTLGTMFSAGTFNFFSKDKIAALGKISQLDAKFQCRGHSIEVSDIVTDGGLIALKGSGYYHIPSNQMHFVTRGKFLRSAGFFSWLFKPLSSAFDAELNGTPQNNKWTIHSTFLKWLRD